MDTDERAARLKLTAQILSALYGLIMIGYLIWMMLPDHRKRLLAMRMVLWTRRNAGRAAFRAGHQAMGLELSGRGENYSLPYLLSLIAGTAARAYDKLRYTQ